MTRTGTVLRAPATEQAVADLERRLGTALPPSYRAFLLASDGAWAQPGWGLCGDTRPPGDGADEPDPSRLGLLDVGRVGWLRDRDPGLVQIWGFDDAPGGGVDEHPSFTVDVPERHYLDAERCDEDHKFGHLLYALQISSDIDGYTVLLNPLVVDGEGEWEAWDFGTKILGGTRYRSFADLLVADAHQLHRQLERQVTNRGTQGWESVARDENADPSDRLKAVHMLGHLGEDERVRDVLLRWAGDLAPDAIQRRQTALAGLSRLGGPDAIPLLISASTDPEPRIRAAALPGLAASDDPAARQAAVTLLINPHEEDFVVHSVTGGGADALLDAWHLGRQARLLEWLAYCGHPRAVPALIDALRDPDLSPADRAGLARYAGRPQDPAVVPALLAAARLPSPPLEAIARALLQLHATDAAAAVLSRFLLDVVTEGPDVFGYLGNAVQDAATLDDLRTTGALVALCLRCPTPRYLRALGWTRGQGPVDVLARAADDPRLHLAAVDALERMRDDAAAGVLAVRAGDGDVLALRALARRRDVRARPHLLDLLDSGDAGLARQGAEGLRDLRDPTTADALVRALAAPADLDLRAVLTHALVALRVPQAADAVARLRGGADPALHRLGEIWAGVAPGT